MVSLHNGDTWGGPPPPPPLATPLQRGKAGPLRPASSAHQWPIMFVILLYSPSCFGQKTAKGPFGLQVKLPHLVPSLPHTVESYHCPFLLLNVKQGIEPRSSVSVTDARPLIGANIFFLHPTKTSLPNSDYITLDWPYVTFFVRKIEKNSRLNYQEDKTTSRDASPDPNLTDTTKNCNKSVISVIQFNTML